MALPQDRNGSFEPKLLPTDERRVAGFDDKILSPQARGLIRRDLPSHREESDGVEAGPSLIPEVRDAVRDEGRVGPSRPLESRQAILQLDALLVKMRHAGRGENRAVFVARRVSLDGQQEVLGGWTSATEGAQLWRQVLSEIRHRGVPALLMACLDGRKGFPQALPAVSPQAQVQLCMVHLVPTSRQFVNGKERPPVAADRHQSWQATRAEAAEQCLAGCCPPCPASSKGMPPYAPSGKLWRRPWTGVVSRLAFPQEIRQIICTTNAVASWHRTFRQVIQTRASFPSEEAALQRLYRALRKVSRKGKPSPNGRTAWHHFLRLWGARLEAAQPRPGR